MRSDSKNSGPVVRVLNGDYPEALVGRMSLGGLERLVAALVRCTNDAADRPKWWPTSIAYNTKINLGLEDEREIKLALKQLVVNCSQFFKERPPQENGTKWSVEWNNENHQRKGSKRMAPDKHTEGRKRYRPLLHLSPLAPLGTIDECPDSPTKNQFLHYFRLNSKRSKTESALKPPAPGGAGKFTTCVHIPFSSDVGRLMAAREHHQMPDDIKLKRLERSEWYINKAAPKGGEVEYEIIPTNREPAHYHWFKMPKRQFHQRRLGLHDPQLLSKFCRPVYVNLDRLDLNKVKSERNMETKQLVVMIDKSEKMCCDVKSGVSKIVRTSPRLRNV